MHTNILFHLSFPEAQAHYIDVTMSWNGFEDREYVDIKMPVWAPGSYLVREYAKNIERLHATNGQGEVIHTEKLNKNTWRIFSKSQHTRIKYSVYAFEKSVRTSFIDQHHAFLSPVGIFFYIDGLLHHPAQVQIALPSFWQKISTGLVKIDETTYAAENFDLLYDSPIEIGNQDTWSFEVDGVLHECAMVGQADYSKEYLTRDITKIIQEENKIWGSNPNSYYLFITHNSSHANGGLEHLNSTVLASPRFNYTNPTTYRSYLSLVAHEYFHLWHVKRLRPKALGPFNYNEENYTTGLWIMEGFTAYYDNLILRRCDLYNEEEYLQQLANDFNIVYNRPGYEIQSAAAASFDTWIKQYRPDENSHNTSISYYNKGAMLAMALDIQMIAHSHGKIRLDNTLKAAYDKFYIIENRGFEEDEFQVLAEETSGTDLSAIFQAAHALHELDYNAYFHAVGYELIDINKDSQQLSLGIRIVQNDGRTIIKSIDRNSAAWIAGLSVDDELIAINGYRIDSLGKVLEYVLSQTILGESIPLTIARDGIIEQIDITPKEINKRSYHIQKRQNATIEERALGNIWLSIG